MSQQEKKVLIRVLILQAREAQRDARRMKKKGLSTGYDRGVRDGLIVAIRALRRERA